MVASYSAVRLKAAAARSIRRARDVAPSCSLSSFTTGAKGNITAEMLKAETNTKVLGKALFIEYIYPFEILSLILLVAIIGAIVLTKKRLRS
jgi:NADH:ubiquinone oxidoreductase subunit 6 (subunit J)